MKNQKKCIIAFSNGLDSRLCVKIMQEQGFDILCAYFKFPFCKNIDSEVVEFCKECDVKLEVFDCTSGKLLKEYLEVIKKPKFSRGVGMNPCVDCHGFILNKLREYSDDAGIEIIVTGEVMGERPMSQYKKSMKIIEDESGLNGRILRPLSAKLLEETKFEKKGIVDREKLYGIQGRRRVEQMGLAEKFGITYPPPAGGCLLCEKSLCKRLKYLVNRGLNKNESEFIGMGRHYVIDGCWVVLGRNEKENYFIETFKDKFKVLECDNFAGPTAIIFDKCNKKTEEKVFELMKAYSRDKDMKGIKKFEEMKL